MKLSVKQRCTRRVHTHLQTAAAAVYKEATRLAATRGSSPTSSPDAGGAGGEKRRPEEKKRATSGTRARAASNTHAHTSARCVRFLARGRPPSSNFYLLKLDNKASSDGGSVGRWVARLSPAFAALPELQWPRWGGGVRKTMMMTVRMKRLAPVKVLTVSRRGGSR